MTTVHSNTQPEVIAIDKIENGIARLLVRWNIRQVSVPDPMTGETREEWQYSERVIKWTLPQLYASLTDVQTYITANQSDIVNWAEATGLNI